MGEWRQVTLGQICRESGGGIQTGPFGSQLHASDYVVDGTPSVMPQNIGDNRIIDEGIARVSNVDMDRLVRHRLRTGDIVYSRRGDVERRALVRNENDGWLCGTGCLRVRIEDGRVHDPRFVSYALGLSESRAWIVRHAVGATMANLNTSILGDVPLRVPKITTQRAIAELLGALDDKIVANDHALGLLDALVRAKYEALDGEPRRIDTIAFNVRAQVSPTVLDPSMPYLGLEHLPRRRMWVTEWGHAQDVTSAKTAFEPGDALFGKLRPYFHKVVATQAWGVCSTDILVVRAKEAELRGLLLAAVSSDEVVRRCAAAAEGTRMPRASWKDVGSATFTWPGEQPARRFSGQVSAQAALAAKLGHESQVLSATRDELLPLLMSGKVRVRDAEKVVEDVV